VPRLLPSLFALCFFLTACGPAAAPAPTAAQHPESTATLPATAIPYTPSPQPGITPTATQMHFDYQTVYQKDGFSIRQVFLGSNAIWHWADFPMPPGRIKNTVKSLGLGRQMTCEKNSTSNMPCSQTLTLPENTEYTLRLANVNGGTGLLTKNGKLLWTGITNGADSFAILSSKQFGSELVFDYSKSNWGNPDQPLWVTASILLTHGKTALLIPDAFAPNVVGNKLVYFRVKSKKDILVFDGNEVGQSYNYVFNLMCCWHGPLLEIASDGKIIDFFAQKNDGWYHVQAGYLPGE
jgi:hypothetical protein